MSSLAKLAIVDLSSPLGKMTLRNTDNVGRMALRSTDNVHANGPFFPSHIEEFW